MKTVLKLGILTVILMMTMISCEEDKNVAATGITLNQTEPVILPVGSTLSLTASVAPSNADQKVVWASSTPGVATVVGGVVTGVLPGTATIYAKTIDGGLTTFAEVTVTNPVNGVSFVNKEVKIAVGEKAIPLIAFTPPSTLERDVVWNSEDPGIASIDPETGEITGISLGLTAITVTSLVNESITAKCDVEVIPVPVAGITLGQKTLSLEIGEKSPALPYTITPFNADNQAVKWSSSNPAAIMVDEDSGEITAVAPGKAIITVSTDEGDYTDECVVSVLHPNDILENPYFDNGGNLAANAGNMFTGWTQVPTEWFETYYDPVPPNISSNQSDNNGSNFFASGQNGFFFANYLSGNDPLAVRNPPNQTSGFYQVVTVEPGTKYYVSADIGFRANANGQWFRDDETIKILSSDGASLIFEVPIPGDTTLGGVGGGANAVVDTQILLDVSGEFKVPAGVTEIRFQLDFRSPRPLTVVGKCQLRITD